MKSGNMAVAAMLVSLGVSTIAHAALSIDFISRGESSSIYRSVKCISTDSYGKETTVQGQPNRNAMVVPLKGLLAGAAGEYKIQCLAEHARSGGEYKAEFSAVKFRQGEYGSYAPEYDENNFAYAINIPLKQTIAGCYESRSAEFKDDCLKEYYGKKPYYVQSIPGEMDVQFRHQRYSSNVGVSLPPNPISRILMPF